MAAHIERLQTLLDQVLDQSAIQDWKQSDMRKNRNPKHSCQFYCSTAIATASAFNLDSSKLATELCEQLQSVSGEEYHFHSKNGFINVTCSEFSPSYTLTESEFAAEAPTVPIKVIGTVRSCFIEKYGTPRQGKLVPHSRGYVELISELDSECVDGLDQFSHLWIVFMFHANDTKHGWKFSSKIKPPKLGTKTGVYSTRSPHRLNPVGMSVVKLESVQSKNSNVRIHVSGLDLIEGTPVIDIKPYHPADSIADSKIPDWISKSEDCRMDVLISSEMNVKLLAALERGLVFYSDIGSLSCAIKESLAQDPRTLHSISKHPAGFLYAFAFDRLDITYSITDSIARILHIHYNPAGFPRQQLRTREWVSWISSQLHASSTG